MNRIAGTHPTRRTLLRAAGGIAAATSLPHIARAAEDKPPIGTWPAGAQGDAVFIGITVPRRSGAGRGRPRFSVS